MRFRNPHHLRTVNAVNAMFNILLADFYNPKEYNLEQSINDLVGNNL